MVVAARGELSDSKVVKLRPVKVGDTTLINDGQMPGIPEDQGAPPCSSAREMCSRMGPRDLFSPPPTWGWGKRGGRRSRCWKRRFGITCARRSAHSLGVHWRAAQVVPG